MILGVKAIRVALICSTVLGLNVIASAQNVRKELQSNYSAMSAALRNKDFQALGKFYSADFTAQDDKGTVSTRTQYLATLKRQVGSATGFEISRSITDCKVNGSQATTTINGSFKASFKLADGKMHKVDQSAVSVNYWIKSGRNWVIKRSQMLKSKVLMDGKPLSAPSGSHTKAPSRTSQ